MNKNTFNIPANELDVMLKKTSIILRCAKQILNSFAEASKGYNVEFQFQLLEKHFLFKIFRNFYF